MEAQSLSLVHLIRKPTTQEAKPPLLILLHGYGSNEQDLFGLSPYLDERFLVVSIRAPLMLMPGGYAWFELGITPNGITFDPVQVGSSFARVTTFIQEAIDAYQVDESRIFLLGFSQGAMISSGIALTKPHLVTGVVLMSGSIPSQDLLPIAPAEQLADKPFLVTHGTVDEVLPISHGRASRDLLQRLPVNLVYHEYPMGHEINMPCLQDMTTWLKERLDERQK
ncbi:MAG: alpha/beta hydrolase [Chloroflexota bacterium]